MTWSNFIFVSEKNRIMLWLYEQNEIFLIEVQSHFFNAKVNGFQMAKIRKKKKWKRKS